jgi:hypothetical protein
MLIGTGQIVWHGSTTHGTDKFFIFIVKLVFKVHEAYRIKLKLKFIILLLKFYLKKKIIKKKLRKN